MSADVTSAVVVAVSATGQGSSVLAATVRQVARIAEAGTKVPTIAVLCCLAL